VEKISLRLVREDYLPVKKPGVLKKSCEDHLQIIKAIENKDLKTLRKIMQNHWGQEFHDVEDSNDKDESIK
jgi:DNA-binding GntR family transcriptional regulator